MHLVHQATGMRTALAGAFRLGLQLAAPIRSWSPTLLRKLRLPRHPENHVTINSEPSIT